MTHPTARRCALLLWFTSVVAQAAVLRRTKLAHEDDLSEPIERLEKSIINVLAKKGGAGDDAIWAEIKNLTQSLLDKVFQSHNSSQELINKAFETVGNCSVDKPDSTAASNEKENLSQAHKLCRANESALKRDVTACDTACGLAQDLKNSDCGKQQNLENSDRSGGECAAHGGESYDAWITRLDNWIKVKAKEWHETKDKCTNSTEKLEDEQARCAPVTPKHAGKKTECDDAQTALETHVCSMFATEQSVCTAYDACFEVSKKTVVDNTPIWIADQEQRKKEWKALKNIQCLLDVVINKQGTMDQCGTDVPPATLNVSIPADPVKKTCTIDVVAPCVQGYTDAEYASLPSDAGAEAPAKTCTPCPGGNSKVCWQENTQYSPVDMAGQGRSDETSAANCQARCKSVSGCEHFSYWANGGCHLQEAGAQQSPQADGNPVSGPPSCEEVEAGCREGHGAVLKHKWEKLSMCWHHWAARDRGMTYGGSHICKAGWSLCTSPQVEANVMTAEECSNVDGFYGAGVSGPGGWKCQQNSLSGKNDIWGCGKVTSKAGKPCGKLSSAIGNRDIGGWKGLTGNGGTEYDTANFEGPEGAGGVMCCKN